MLAYKATEELRRQTSAEYKAAHTDLLRDRVKDDPTDGVAAPTHPSHTPANNGDVVFLESLIDSVPDQATSDHDGARCWIVGHLRELSGVDLDSPCRREPGIHDVTTTLHLTGRGVESEI